MNTLKIIKRLWRWLPLSDHSRWRITVALLAPILPFIKGSVVSTAFLREREWQRQRIRPFYGDGFPQLPRQSKPDIFIWGVIDWRLRIQRPQHLARGFSDRGHRVFYISTAFVNTRRSGFELEKIDDTGCLFSVRLHLKGRPHIHTPPSNDQDLVTLRTDTAKLLEWTASRLILSIVQHPYWYDLASSLPNSHLIYDCIDHHEGFGTSSEGISDLETRLLTHADAVVTTSQWLYDFASDHSKHVSLIRNAGEYEFFSSPPNNPYKDPKNRRVLGYYGVIAEWMDVELLRKVALSFPDCLLLLVGADECGARLQLASLPNVHFTGEVKYEELPYYLYGMDVCLLPFRVIPLTIATNPVKVYEYLAAGKPVISIDLPEMKQFEGLVSSAGSHEDFLAQIRSQLSAPHEPARSKRQSFAEQNSWAHRVEHFSEVIDKIHRPLVSVIVLTFNNIELTRACLSSIERYTDYAPYEVIVIDNASSDGTPEFLALWASEAANRSVVYNDSNLGFAAGNNIGLNRAEGEYFVILNNDTVVTAGWLPTLLGHLRRNPELGIVGPVTDNIGNEARIRLRFQDFEEMNQKARQYTLSHMGKVFSIQTLAFYCVMIRKTVYQQIGGLDESFGLGFFEDDDYCRRVEKAGWQIGCAEDIFIHHHLSASFGKLGRGRQELLSKNRKIYEEKWGPWTPHRHR